MGGYGSIQNSLKNNKALLRKKNFFKRKKGISDKKKELLKGSTGELEFVEVSQRKLDKIKKKIKVKAIIRDRRTLILYLLIVFVFTILVVFYLKRISAKEAQVEKYGETKDYQKNLELYNIYLEEGEIQLGKLHIKNATYFYTKALSLFPDDSLAISKLNEIKLLERAR